MPYLQQAIDDATVFGTRFRDDEVRRFFDGATLLDPAGLKRYEDDCYEAFVADYGLPTGDGRRNVVFFLSDLSGCGYARCFTPVRSFQRASERYNALVSECVCSELIRWADVIVWQRMNDVSLVSAWQAAKNLGKRQVYELDDNLHEVPESNPARRVYHPGSPASRGLLTWMKSCDAVIVSTAPLAEYYGRLVKKPFAVVENTIETTPAPEHGDHERVRVLWAGSPTHVDDLALISGAIRRLRDDLGKRVKFVLMGFDGKLTLPMDPDAIADGGALVRHDASVKADRFVPWRGNVEQFRATLAASGCEIGLCPLADNAFNRSKSHLKWLEYTMAGLATIAVDLPPYNLSITNGHDGLLVDGREESWYRAIRTLVENRALRRTLAANARATIAVRFDAADVWRRYESVFDGLF